MMYAAALNKVITGSDTRNCLLLSLVHWNNQPMLLEVYHLEVTEGILYFNMHTRIILYMNLKEQKREKMTEILIM